MPAHTVAILPGVTVGPAVTVMLIGIAVLLPQLLPAVIKPLYVPGVQLTFTVTGIGLDGNAVPAATSGRPAGLPVHVMP